MLTGDASAVAEGVARELRIDPVFAQVLPDHKVNKCRSCRAQVTGWR